MWVHQQRLCIRGSVWRFRCPHTSAVIPVCYTLSGIYLKIRVGLSSWLIRVKHVPVGRSWTQSQGVHLKNDAFSPLQSPAQELYPRAAVPWGGHASISRAHLATSCSAHWQTKQLKVSGLLTAGLTKHSNLFCPENINPGKLRNEPVLL